MIALLLLTDQKRLERYRPHRKAAARKQQVPTTKCDYEDNIPHAQGAVQNPSPTELCKLQEDLITKGAVQNPSPTEPCKTTRRSDYQDIFLMHRVLYKNPSPTELCKLQEDLITKGAVQNPSPDYWNFANYREDLITKGAEQKSSPTGTLQTTRRSDYQVCQGEHRPFYAWEVSPNDVIPPRGTFKDLSLF
ncbi:hypothetical protein CEXT_746971 [Caerostris extrusa]|uniref:Uncharacterized protein n=1 Tax=Caerostris extrusa TaxID=172846 RepID=A0AAV4SNJ1_CAEEX|nr:hypothetical protein CEXT_746971 [Caerostris extrusa]